MRFGSVWAYLIFLSVKRTWEGKNELLKKWTIAWAYSPQNFLQVAVTNLFWRTNEWFNGKLEMRYFHFFNAMNRIVWCMNYIIISKNEFRIWYFFRFDTGSFLSIMYVLFDDMSFILTVGNLMTPWNDVDCWFHTFCPILYITTPQKVFDAISRSVYIYWFSIWKIWH